MAVTPKAPCLLAAHGPIYPEPNSGEAQSVQGRVLISRLKPRMEAFVFSSWLASGNPEDSLCLLGRSCLPTFQPLGVSEKRGGDWKV